jgi:hypothetical protein
MFKLCLVKTWESEGTPLRIPRYPLDRRLCIASEFVSKSSASFLKRCWCSDLISQLGNMF